MKKIVCDDFVLKFEIENLFIKLIKESENFNKRIIILKSKQSTHKKQQETSKLITTLSVFTLLLEIWHYEIWHNIFQKLQKDD